MRAQKSIVLRESSTQACGSERCKVSRSHLIDKLDGDQVADLVMYTGGLTVLHLLVAELRAAHVVLIHIYRHQLVKPLQPALQGEYLQNHGCCGKPGFQCFAFQYAQADKCQTLQGLLAQWLQVATLTEVGMLGIAHD